MSDESDKVDADIDAAPQPRRWYQLRLSTLLLLTLSIALACGWWVDHARLMRLLTIEESQIKVFSLQKIKPDEAERIIRKTFPETWADPLNVAADPRSNALIVNGSESKLSMVEALLLRLDQ